MTATVNLAPLPKQRFTDSNGNPLTGGKVFTYAAGTTTKQNSYTDSTGSTPNPNPVILDSRGEAAIWLDQTLAYKVVLSPSTDTDPPTAPIWTIDNIPAGGALATALASQASNTNGAAVVALYNGAEQAYWNAANLYALALEEGSIINPVQGADKTGSADSAAKFNAAILRTALAGGGTVRPAPGMYKWLSPVLLPSYITLDLTGCTINGGGIGTNDLIHTAAVIGGVLTDITTQYGTSAQGAGTNFVTQGRVTGGILQNANIGIRGHRLNYGSYFQDIYFANTLTNAWVTSHSWGLWVSQNTVWSPAIMKDFVDWTLIEGNAFQGPGSTANTVGLLITTGGYGGSYSSRIVSNGFHDFTTAISFTCQGDNTIIEGNHFEDCVNHVVGDSNTRSGFRIKNNWMKANLVTPGAVTPVTFLALIDSDIGPNFFSTDGASTYADYYVLNTGSTYGNRIEMPFSLTSLADVSLLSIAPGNLISYRGGSNNAALAQPTYQPLASSSGLTFEQYKHTYNPVANQMPFCTVTYSGTTITILTWIVASATGTFKHCAFAFDIAGSTTYVMAGFFCKLDIVYTVNKDFFGGGAGPTMTLSNSGGFILMTITGAPSGGNITGWVKEL